jgi:hypothetical protein
MKTTTALLLCLLLSSCITFRVNSRGYADLKPEDKPHFVPFTPASLTHGMKPGEPLQEITAADILQSRHAVKQLVVLHEGTSCVVGNYPLQYWQRIEDSLHRYGGRLMVVTGRYDAYDSIQKALIVQPISYQVYVTSGARYGDSRIKTNRKYWSELLERELSGTEYENYMGRVMVLKGSDTPVFIPAPALLSYH